jgi:ADP-ribose pyrophosphatase
VPVATEPSRSRRVYGGAVLSLDLEDWEDRGGGYEHEIVRHPGAAGVLPITSDNSVLLVKQFRPAIRDMLTEIPAGLLDVSGEDALTCATRELREETGYGYRSIEFLGGYYSSAGFTDEYVHLFWARTDDDQSSEPEDGIELVRMPLEDMLTAARGGKIRDVKTALALLLFDAAGD